MSNWNKAKTLITKGFKSGYFRLCYGEIVAGNTGNHNTPYPFTEEETAFLMEFFKDNNKEERRELRKKVCRCVNLTYRLKMNKDIIIDIVVDMFGGKRVELERLSLTKIFMRYYEEGLDEDLLRECMTE